MKGKLLDQVHGLNHLKNKQLLMNQKNKMIKTALAQKKL